MSLNEGIRGLSQRSGYPPAYRSRNHRRQPVAVACLLLIACGFLRSQPKPSTNSWRGWDSYQVILWSTGPAASPQLWPDRVREAGFSAVPLVPGSQPAPGLGYYVENLAAELAFLHGRQQIYDSDWKAYTATRDKKRLVRNPCFDDPAFWEALTGRLEAEAERNAHRQPLLYDLRDEPSIGAYTNPMDYCFCPHTLRAFREWLRKRYGSLAALNTEWGTTFANWNDVVPFTTYEIKDRERADLAARRPENFAPWADHREYMDWSFARALDRMRSIIREHDQQTPVGIEGVQMPSAWGGYDLWRLSQVVDWVEPYDLNNSRAILASFLPAHAPVLYTYFGSDVRVLRRTAWARLLDGDRGPSSGTKIRIGLSPNRPPPCPLRVADKICVASFRRCGKARPG